MARALRLALSGPSPLQAAYELGTRCAVLSYHMVLPACYALPGTDVVDCRSSGAGGQNVNKVRRLCCSCGASALLLVCGPVPSAIVMIRGTCERGSHTSV
eukprot:2213196-Rhodomonas_salina.1